MLEELLLVARQVGTLFLMMLAGYLMEKTGRLTPAVLPRLNDLLLTVVIPCMLVTSLQLEATPELIATMEGSALLAAGVYVLYCLVVLPLFPRQPPQIRTPLQYGVIYGNIGFMGLPLVSAVLGQEAMVYATVVYVIFNVFNWSHGIVFMGGRERFSLRRAVLNPGILAIALGLVLFFGGIGLPPMIKDAVGTLGSMNTPLAMVLVGAQMAEADLKAILTDLRLYAAGACRLLGIPVLTALVLLPFRPDPMLYSVLIILAATPTAGVTVMFAQQFDKDAVCAAKLVTGTTLLSIITIPCCAVLAKLLGGV